MKLFFKIITRITIITLSVIVVGVTISFLNDNEPPPKNFTLQLEKLKPHHTNEFNISLDKNLKEIKVYCKTNFIDTLKLDSLFLKINSFDTDYKTFMHVYDHDSMIVYTHYYVGCFSDSIFGKAMGGYEY